MSLLSFFGDLLIAFGPAIVLLIFYVGRHASLIILTLAAAFLWLLSALLASLLWFAAVPIRSSQPWAIFTGVTMQELARWCFFLLLGKAERELEIIATHGPGSALNESVHAFATGYGFGVFNGLITFTTLLASTLSPGYIFSKPCPGTPMAFVAAFTTNIFIMLNIVWALLSFDGYRTKSLTRIALVVASHYAASYSTLFLSSTIPWGCTIGNIIPIVILVPLAYLAWKDFDAVLDKEKARLAALPPPPPPETPPPHFDEAQPAPQENEPLAGDSTPRTSTEPYRRSARTAAAE